MKMSRLVEAVKEASVFLSRCEPLSQEMVSKETIQGAEVAAIRRASLDLSRALANIRKSDYEKLPGEK